MRFEDLTGAMFIHMEGLQIGQGQQLRRGDFLGFIGTSGLSTGNHLHYSRLRQVLDGMAWYAKEIFVDPLSAEGGFTAVLTAPPVEPPKDVVSGAWPAPGAAALIASIADCTPAEVVAEAAYEGCILESIWMLVNGLWRDYIVGAPDAINSDFPATIPAGTALYVRHK